MRAFSNKAVSGGNLFRRKHGFKSEEIPVGEFRSIELVVPYNAVKINEVEFVNARVGDNVDFKVLDTPTGAITSTLEATGFTPIPNFQLNQFGFKAELPDGLYRDTSEYDADLIKDVRIVITYFNNGDTPHIIRGNITYHEVK